MLGCISPGKGWMGGLDGRTSTTVINFPLVFMRVRLVSPHMAFPYITGFCLKRQFRLQMKAEKMLFWSFCFRKQLAVGPSGKCQQSKKLLKS